MFFRRAKPTGARAEETPTASRDVLREEERYTREVLRVAGVALVTAIALYLSFTVVALISSIGTSSSAPSISIPRLEQNGAGAALIVLLPLSVALQVLMRMPRDPEASQLAQSIAQRQFWGNIAATVSVASGFVGLGAFLDEFVSSVARAEAVDFMRVAGVPLGAGAALLIAADAVALAALEARRLNLGRERRHHEIVLRRLARTRILGKAGAHPVAAAIIQGMVVLLLTIVPAAVLVQLQFRHANVTAAFVAAAVILATFAVVTFVQVVRATVMLRMLDAVPALGLFALVCLIYGMQVGVSTLTISDGVDNPVDCIPAIVLGLAVPIPAVVVAAVLTSPRRRHLVAAPLLDLTRRRLDKEIYRLNSAQDTPAPRESWEPFAWTAIVLGVLPMAALPAAAIAQLLRRGSALRRKLGLMVAAWLVSALMLVLQIVALLLLPSVGEALGWFTIP